MKTVGDFYNAGLEFVMGDECDGSDGQIFSKKWVEYSNENDADFVNCTPTKFAWRTNTGEKPSFSGLIEFTYNGEGCEMQEFRHSNNINWSIVKKWRPSLNQSTIQTETPEEKEAFEAMTESKPVFTQAMADASELPPVGSEFLITVAVDCFEEALMIAKHDHLAWVRFKDGSDEILNSSVWLTKPIKSEREKAIDEMQEVVCSQGFLAKMDVSFGIAEEIYNANYRKLTPSQAKAYDDKTEYFGEDYKR